MDLSHCQIMEGDVAMKLRQYLRTGRVGHLQIAGVPMRHEPRRSVGKESCRRGSAGVLCRRGSP
jgi:hypothetical protein